MTTLSRDQLRDLLVGAGMKKNSPDTETLISIAYAESSGDPSKHNTKPPDDSYGLWQINLYGKLGPDRRKRFGLASDSQLLDPATNAKAAVAIYKSQGLDAWTTYKNGDWLKFSDNTTGFENGKPSEANSGIDNPLNDVPNSIKDAVNSLGSNLLKGTANIGGIAIGIALLVLGIVLLARKPIGNVLPTGKAAKALKAIA